MKVACNMHEGQFHLSLSVMVQYYIKHFRSSEMRKYSHDHCVFECSSATLLGSLSSVRGETRN